jgi:hypothetical protein
MLLQCTTSLYQTTATPRIAVTFDVNTNGDLKVQAVQLPEKSAKKEQEVTAETETAMEVTAEEVTVETEGVQPVPPGQVEVATMEGTTVRQNILYITTIHMYTV